MTRPSGVFGWRRAILAVCEPRSTEPMPFASNCCIKQLWGCAETCTDKNREVPMKRFASALAIGIVLILSLPDNASAIVCARGVYRAGCVGPHGAVGVRRYGYGYHRYGYGYHRTVVVHRRVY
jgi:hypothetical protein